MAKHDMTQNTIPGGDEARTTEAMKTWRKGVLNTPATQAEAAALLGMSASAYGEIERTGKLDRRTKLAMRMLWSMNHTPPKCPI